MLRIQRTWTAEEAEEWTREDWLVIFLSPVAYILIMIGMALSCLLLIPGFVLLGTGILVTMVIHWVIDPKLKAVSQEYEIRQKIYVEEIENATRWEGHHG